MHLPAFQQSVFLQSLGWAIANNIWQCGVLWVLYQAGVTFFHNASAKFKNNLSTALLFGNFLWFVVTFFTKIIYLRNYIPAITANQMAYPNVNLVSGNLNLQTFISSVVITLPYLSVAYIILLLIFAIKLINSYRNTNFIKRSGLSKPSAEWRLFVEKVANHITITKKIKIWFSGYVDVPATIGFFKPVILIPLASLNHLTAAQMEAVILHEISHIKRNDYLVNLFISLIETILFFNPFVVLLSKIIKKERENCCDDFVLQYQYDRHSYASALLVLEQYRKQQFHLALAATSGRQQLLFRIKRIMEVKNNHDSLNYGQKLLALVLSTGIICSLAWLTPQKKTDEQLSKERSGKIVKSFEINSVNKIKDSSLIFKAKEAKNITSGIKLQSKLQRVKDEQDNFKNIPESTPNSESNTEDQFNRDRLQKNDETADALSLYSYDNKVSIQKKQADSDLLKSANSNFSFLPNSLFSDLLFLENVHIDIDVNLNKLQTLIEKENNAISSFNWNAMKDRLMEGFGKLKKPTVERPIKNYDKYFIAGEREFEKINERKEFYIQPKNTIETRHRRIRLKQGDTLFFADADGTANLFHNEVPENNLPVLPPPPIKERFLKVATPPAFRQPHQSEYTYQYQTPPKARTPHLSPIHINYEEGSLIINGEKINLADLKKSNAEKIISKLKANKRLIEIQLKN